MVHLHTHTHYSLLESSCKIPDLVNLCVKHKMPACAITDNGNMFGVVDWYNSCKEKEIKPIIGMDIYIAPDGRHIKGQKGGVAKPNTRLVLLAKNYSGYQALCKISTIGYREGFYYKPRVDYEILEKYSDNLICLSGGMNGDIAHCFTHEGKDKALEKIDFLKSIYAEHFFLEIQNIQDNKKVNEFLVSVSQDKKIPLVAANEIYFTNKSDHLAQRVLYCIGTNRTLNDSRFSISKESYFKSPADMKKIFSDLPEAIDNTMKISDMCNFEFKTKDKYGKPIYNMPTFKVEGSMYDELKKCSYTGLETRFAEAEKLAEPIEGKSRYYERIESELKTIKETGFVGYFLIVQDFIKWAKDRNIPVGPGRGSGAGSLVAYCLMITDLDPIKHDLIFERFLNKERISIPDFDIDFCQQRRGEVIDYVVNKYGVDSVSQIITYGKLQARASIRDVGRVLGIEYSEVDSVARLIPEELGITIKSALQKEPRFKEMMEDDPKVAQLIKTALQIEGLNRHVSVHAAGIIISNVSLLEHAPLYKGKDGETIIQYDMHSSESIGLVKFDFLGLKTLTYINKTFELIKKVKNKTITQKDISLSDEGIYKMISSGSTAGIFQFESAGITELILKVKPTSFNDITAINALYRPGPMKMLDDYTKRKHGKEKVKYPFKELEEILKPTYGIVVYQEQVQMIAYKIANYSLGEADILRRAMGKKKKKDMQTQRNRFITGAVRNGYDKLLSEELFDLMARFAEYGFNKSHAAAYCVITAQTAWLKQYYPLEFFASLLSSDLSNTNKIIGYIKDAKYNGVTVSPPCINSSEYEFSILGDKIYFGLGAIKTIGQSLAEEIVRVRESLDKKEFKDITEFFEKVSSQFLNKKSIEQLILSGSFDCFGLSREELINSYSHIMSRVSKKSKDKQIGQVSLFEGMSDTVVSKEAFNNKWSRVDKLKHEKEALGFFFTDHPLKGFEKILSKFALHSICNVVERNISKHPAPISIGGIINKVSEKITRKGQAMAFVALEDLTGTVPVIVFPELYSEIQHVLVEDEIVFFKAQHGDNGGVIASEFYTLDQKLTDTKGFCLNLDMQDKNKFVKIKNILKKYKGTKEIMFNLRLPGQSIEMTTNDEYGVESNKELINELVSCISKPGSVDVICR